MKITFILPGIGKKANETYLKSWLMEPLTIAVLNQLTPGQYAREFFDDRVEAVDYDTETDVIAITVETYTARRAYAIARRFRDRGKLVIMGGYHATLRPEEILEHADIVVQGNAETVWARLLADIESGTFQPVYKGMLSLDYGLPDRSIYQDKLKKYLPISLVEIGRGCHHNCEFCSIQAYYAGSYQHRRIEDILAEIRQSPNRIFFFVDDSIFSDPVFARELFRQITPLRIIWVTQVTLDIARDVELLKLMKQSGCAMILIGFESIEADNLVQMNKAWTARLGDRDQLIENIHAAGISIYASFVFGFDSDDEASFQKNLAFCRRHQFFVAAFNHLLAFPGTETFDRYRREGRLFDDHWWLRDDYTFGTISFSPKRITDTELRQLCRLYKKKYYTLPSIVKRGLTLWLRTQKPLIHLVYWYQNILFHFEVDKRYGIPVGMNLDEPKK